LEPRPEALRLYGIEALDQTVSSIHSLQEELKRNEESATGPEGAGKTLLLQQTSRKPGRLSKSQSLKVVWDYL
jgi:hypothetical protein